MFDSLAEKIVKRLTYAKVIDESDRELYLFGMQQFLSAIFGLFSIFIIIMVMGELLNGVLFFAAFSVLRQYAGGYHAETKIGCYFLSIFSVTIILILVKYFVIDAVPCMIITVALLAVIILLSPVEAINKPLDQTERVVYRRRTIVIALSEFVVAVVLVCLGLTKQASSIMFAYGLVVFSLLMGMFSLRRKRKA